MIPHVLILGGTAEARRLATLVHDRFGEKIRLTSSLAGRTRRPVEISGDVRTGGFGGVPGLVDYIEAEAVSMLIDATHPFAATISRHAAEAVDKSGEAPRLRLSRPPWVQPEGLNAHVVPDMDAVASALRSGGAKRVLVTTGVQNLAVFASLPDIWFLVRQIEAHEKPLPMENADIIVQKPPFSVEGEVALMQDHNIDTVITKESGGEATAAKLQAATELGIRTILIKRPPEPPGDKVATPKEALAWIEARVETQFSA